LFTKKKFYSLKLETQHKWVIKWLTSIYQLFITNRINSEKILLFASDYDRILEWMNINSKEKPEIHEHRAWVEFVSDAIHSHRVKAGISPKDHDLADNTLIKVTNNDTLKNKTKTLNYYVAIDSFRSLFNVGAIFRICDAAGFKSVILGNTPGKEHPSVQKTSMGSSSWVNSENTNDLATTLVEKKDKGYTIIGIETMELSEKYTVFNWPEKAVIVIGNEEYGISRHVLRVCDKFVHIPMFGRKNSINVANAASVVMFHIAQKEKL
jgi:tRNA G18 (ribose-2'-O)-methylase SpoU